MTTTELLALFRSEVFDLELPYLWSDTLIYGYIDDAQKQFCRDTNGIADSRSFKVAITPGTQWYAIDSKILKIRDAIVQSTGNPMPIISVEKMHENDMRFDTNTGTTRALISGLDEGMLRTWPIPYTSTVPTVRANSTAYLAGALISLTATDSTTRFCLCVTAGTTAAAQGTLYTGSNTELITDGTAVFTDETARMTMTVELRTFRLPVTVEAGDDLEIPEQYHPRVLHWVKHRAYSIQDAETFDKGASDRYLAMHNAACAAARIEQNRVRRPVSTVTYGGI